MLRLLAFACLACLALTRPLAAQTFETAARAAILIDHRTGAVL